MRLSELNISKPQLIQLTDFYVFNARNKALFLRKKNDEVMSIMDDLMEELRETNPRLYNVTIEKLKRL